MSDRRSAKPQAGCGLSPTTARRLRLRADGLRASDHPMWGGPGWKVFLDEPPDIERTIRSVEMNPVKARMPAQRWSFVKEYDNWPRRLAAPRVGNRHARSRAG